MTRRAWMAAALGAPLLLSCAPVEGLRARYDLERRLWRAQFYERRINFSFMQASKNDARLAIAAFRDVIAHDALKAPGAKQWDESVAGDIREIELSSRIELANLYFLSERYADAGTLYQETVAFGQRSLPSDLDARLGAARSLYMVGESSEALEQCAAILQEIVASPDFWAGRVDLDPVFLNIPVVIARMYRDGDDRASSERYGVLASDFYRRVAETWPGTPIATQARIGSIQLSMVREDWDDAVRELGEMLAATPPPEGADGFELLQGELLAFASGQAESGRRVLSHVVASHPGSEASFAARYDLIALDRKTRNETDVIADLRALEEEPGVPGTVASRAMLARALILEARGFWDESLELLQRLQELYPFTTPAVEAPMVVVKHYVDRGEASLAEQSLERARVYYLSLIDRHSQFEGDRLMVQGALTASYMMTGRAAELAGLLGSPDAPWDDAIAAAGLLKAAEISESALDDRQKAAEMLKKCIERFPETRYSRIAQRRLDELEGSP